jgi:hypothetical protein
MMKIFAVVMLLAVCVSVAHACDSAPGDWRVGTWEGEVRTRGYSRSQAALPVAVDPTDLACARYAYTIPYSCTYFYDVSCALMATCTLKSATYINEDGAASTSVQFFFSNVLDKNSEDGLGFIVNEEGVQGSACVPESRAGLDVVVTQFSDLFSAIPSCPNSPDLSVTCSDSTTTNPNSVMHAVLHRVNTIGERHLDDSAASSLTISFLVLVSIFFFFF